MHKSLMRCTLAAVAFAALPAFAGDFQTLPTTGELRVFGANNSNRDPLYILEGSDQGGGNYAPPSYLSLLDSRVTEFEAPIDGVLEEVGTVYDFVFRDTRDDMLVIGTRVILNNAVDGELNEFEINFLYRNGFTGYSAAAAWTYATDFDLRMYSAARSAAGLNQADVFDPDTVGMQSDINVSESNPSSGLYLIKTDAPNYTVAEGAIRMFQAGEEGQPPTNVFVSGFVAAPVPEPSTYAMLLGGLGLLGVIARRRRV